jgi:hypothetical protein
MKNITAALIFGTWLSLAISNLSCASLPTVSPPPLDKQILEISKDRPGVHFQYRECTEKFLLWCTKEELRRVEFDFNDPKVREKLIDVGFHLVVWEKP